MRMNTAHRVPHLALMVVIAFVLLATLLPMDARGQTPPPSFGDWVITDETTIEGEDIDLRGNLIVEDGGSLTLIDCRLTFHTPGYMLYDLVVEEGGVLNATGTVIRGSDMASGFYFDCPGIVHLDECEVYYVVSHGVQLYNSESYIINSDIHDALRPSGDGITVYDGSPLIAGNFIHDNYKGIDVHDSASPMIKNNELRNNNYGLTSYDNSIVNLENNYICDSMIYGIRLYNYTQFYSYGDSFENNHDALSIGGYTNARVTNGHVISSNYNGFVASDESYMWVNDSLIERTAESGIILINNPKVFVNDCEFAYCEGTPLHTSETGLLEVYDSVVRDNEGFGANSRDNSTLIIERCEFYDNNNNGVQLSHFSFGYIGNCSIYENDNSGMDMGHYATGWVYNNMIRDNSYSGIACGNNCTAWIKDNDISGHTEAPGIKIQVPEDRDIKILNNNLHHNKYGIYINSPARPHCTDNIIYDNIIAGVNLIKGASPIIEGSNINGSGWYGIFVRDVSDPQIYNCSISGSGIYDIWTGNKASPTFIDCDFDHQSIFFNDTSSAINIGWWVDVELLDDEDKPVEDASLEIRNAAIDKVGPFKSDSNGRITDIPVVEYALSENNERTDLTPHNFTAAKGNLIGYKDLEIRNNRFVDILMKLRENIEPPTNGGGDDGDDDDDGGGIIDDLTGELVINFVSPKDGAVLKGNVTIEIEAGGLIDRIRLVLIGDNETVIYDGPPTKTVFHVDTTQFSDGSYALKVTGYNDALEKYISKKINVRIENDKASVMAVVATTAIASISVAGAAMVTASTRGGGVVLSSGSEKAIAMVGRGSLAGTAQEGGQEYAEERLYRHTKRQRSISRGAQIAAIGVSVVALGTLFSYTSMPVFSMNEMLTAIPIMLLSVGIVVVFMEAMEAIAAKLSRVRAQFQLWGIGFISLILTTVLFRMPFGSPGKTLADEKDRKSGIPALTKLLAAPALIPVFFMLMDYNYLLATTGIYTALMLFFFDAFPFSPLEGKRVYNWNKGIWAATFLCSLVLLYGWLLFFIEHALFNIIGGLSLLLLLGALAYQIAVVPEERVETSEVLDVIVVES